MITSTQHVLARLKTQYGEMIPLTAIENAFSDDRVPYVMRHYYWCPVSRKIYNRNTGRMVTAKTMGAGPTSSPINATRGEVILRTGVDPHFCGRNLKGTWYRLVEDGERIYCE